MDGGGWGEQPAHAERWMRRMLMGWNDEVRGRRVTTWCRVDVIRWLWLLWWKKLDEETYMSPLDLSAGVCLAGRVRTKSGLASSE
jgi:hypothetical protein